MVVDGLGLTKINRKCQLLKKEAYSLCNLWNATIKEYVLQFGGGHTILHT